MRYVLTQMTLNSSGEVELSEEQFNSICKARYDLTELTSVEEKFDLLLENHFELEKEIAIIATRDMMFSDYDEISLWNIGNILNRRILNVLSSCRTYIDHSDHHMCEVFGSNSAQRSLYLARRSGIYDSRPEYRIAEALRNYVQHRGFPLHKWNLGGTKVGDLKDPGHEYHLELLLMAKQLREDGKFKKRALDDIDDIGGAVNLTWLLRGYVKALSDINNEVREICAARANDISQIFSDSINQYKSVDSSNYAAIGLAAAKLNEDGVCLRHCYLVPSAIEYRDKFIRKNRSFVRFERRYISSKADMNRARI